MGFRTWTTDPIVQQQQMSNSIQTNNALLQQQLTQPPSQNILDLQSAYQSGQTSGIPNELLQYAQNNPGSGIDTSGHNLATSDPMYGFYNQPAGTTQGVNWFPTDDRNNTQLQQALTNPPADTYTPYNLALDQGGTSAGTTSYAGRDNAGAAARQLGLLTTDTNTGLHTGGTLETANTGLPTGGTTASGAAPGTTTAPGTAAAPGTPQYDFSQILAQYGINSQQLTGQVMPVLQQILARMNQGYDPATLSALRSQATSQIPQQYEQAARAFRTNLLRQGAIGAGELPANAGDILRSFAPLEQARNEAVAGANRNTILANQAEVARNQERGSQAIGQVLQAQGLTNQLLSAGIDYMKATKLADFDAATRTKLAQMGIDSNEKLAALQSQTQLTLGGMDAATRLALGNLDSETTKWVSSLNSDTQKQLAQLSSTTAINMNNLDNATRLKVADIENAPGSLKHILLASVLSSALSGGVGQDGKPIAGALSTLANKGVEGLINIFKGKTPEEVAKAAAAAAPAVAAAVGGAGAAGATAAGGTTAAGGGLGASITGLMTNPITIGVGAAIAATVIWLKSQAHWEANKWVNTYQDKFDTQMSDVNQQFWQLAQSGQLTKAQGQQIFDSAKGMIDTYESQRVKFEGQGSDEKKVAGQALATFRYWYGDGGSKYLGAMQDAINGLAA